MRGVVAVGMALLVSLGGSGCFATDEDPEAQSEDTGSGTTTGAAGTQGASPAGGSGNAAPSVNLTASALNGSAPLTVAFTLDGSDPEGGPLSWTLAFADNGTTANGTALPANATHVFEEAGNYTVVLTAVDAGNLSANATVTIAVAAGGPLPEPQAFEGTLTGAPYLPQVGSPNGLWSDASATHAFTMAGQADTMTIVLTYEDGVFFTDLDLFITDPNGEETAAEAAGQEPPVVIASPVPGEWSIEVFAYGAEGEVDYSITVAYA